MKQRMVGIVAAAVIGCAAFASGALAAGPCFITVSIDSDPGGASATIESVPAEATPTTELLDTDCDGLPDAACLECTPAYQADNCPFVPNGPDLGTCTAGLQSCWGKRAVLMLIADRAVRAAWRRRMPTLTVMVMPAITAAVAGLLIRTAMVCATGMITAPQRQILCRRMPTVTGTVMNAAGRLTVRPRLQRFAVPGTRSADRWAVRILIISFSFGQLFQLILAGFGPPGWTAQDYYNETEELIPQSVKDHMMGMAEGLVEVRPISPAMAWDLVLAQNMAVDLLNMVSNMSPIPNPPWQSRF